MGLGFVMGVGLVAKVGRSAHFCFSVMGWVGAPFLMLEKNGKRTWDGKWTCHGHWTSHGIWIRIGNWISMVIGFVMGVGIVFQKVSYFGKACDNTTHDPHIHPGIHTYLGN